MNMFCVHCKWDGDALLARAEKAEAEAKDNSEAWRNARSLAMRLEAENAALKARVKRLEGVAGMLIGEADRPTMIADRIDEAWEDPRAALAQDADGEKGEKEKA
jgi:hypothetical protein